MIIKVLYFNFYNTVVQKKIERMARPFYFEA